MKTIVVSPHPDDEVLGAGGTLLRRKAEGGQIAWLIVTAVSVESGWSVEKVTERVDEISQIKTLFEFDEVFSLNFPTAQLDVISMGDLVAGISDAFKSFEPEEVFVPHFGDVHTDHKIVFDAVASCTKWFRHPFIKRVLAYETLSETEFGLDSRTFFRPTVFFDIAPYLEEKLRALGIYKSELGVFPFPRSHVAIRALAELRGAAAGYAAAEAFELLRERS